MTYLAYMLYFVFVLFSVCVILQVSWKMWTRKLSFLSFAPNIPWLGSIPFFGTSNHDLYKTTMLWTMRYNHLFVSWFSVLPNIRCGRVEYLQPLLRSQVNISKALGYHLIVKPWLGDGLLISTGEKWKKRRLALTAAFHFAILSDFMEIFQKHAMNLVRALEKKVGDGVEVQWLISLSTLDTICETSMGVAIHALDASNNDYVRAVYDIKQLTLQRVTNPFMFFSDTIYRMTSNGKKYYECLDIVHNFTQNIIRRKISEREKGSADVRCNQDSAELREGIEDTELNNNSVGKRHQVFIDVLLDMYENGEIDVAGIREEVDTFMFEGHDTTSSALSWTLYEIGRHSDIQERVYDELKTVSGVTNLMDKVKSLRYMECVIKESLRLHPPVPGYERSLDTDIVVNGNTIPAGTEIGISALSVHLNPEYWDNPTVFTPSRFEDVEFLKRNPYCYLPFSAGPRNCIGQKFAMLEIKMYLYHILMNFRLRSLQEPEEIQVGIDLVLNSINGIVIEFQKREV